MRLEFISDRVKKEFASQQFDKRVRAIIFFLLGFYSEYIIVVQHIFRTAKEQYEIYKNDPVYKKAPFESNHQYWRSIDITLKLINGGNAPKEIYEAVRDVVNTYFVFNKIEDHSVAVYHDVGRGWHLHIQVSYLNETALRMEE